MNKQKMEGGLFEPLREYRWAVGFIALGMLIIPVAGMLESTALLMVAAILLAVGEMLAYRPQTRSRFCFWASAACFVIAWIVAGVASALDWQLSYGVIVMLVPLVLFTGFQVAGIYWFPSEEG